MRRVTAVSRDAGRGTLAIDEHRPWNPNEPLTSLAVDYDFTGPEQIGLSRAERRVLLEAA